MTQVEITTTFGPASRDRTALSKASRSTIDALYQHPLSHNLEWTDVVSLFEKLGSAEQKAHNEIAFSIGGEHHRVRKPHSKDLTPTEVMTFRHMLTRAGWAPQAAGVGAGPSSGTAAPVRPDLLAVVEHGEARLYHLDIQSPERGAHLIRPSDPHHLVHTSPSHNQGHHPPEDHVFYERIAQALLPGGRIVLIGHGEGQGNAAEGLSTYLHSHHPETFQRVMPMLVADLSSLSAPQLLDLGRRALTVSVPSGVAE